jgi:hypothetical protein
VKDVRSKMRSVANNQTEDVAVEEVAEKAAE